MQKRFPLGLAALICSTNIAAAPHTESAISQLFTKIQTNPQQLSTFLYAMPKGGELHDHLGGAGMAENMMMYAADDHLCVNRDTFGVSVDPTCPAENQLANVMKNTNTYNAIINAWSMRQFDSAKESAHDHCFAAFGKFSPIVSPHSGEILAEMAERADVQNEHYLEVMITPDDNASGLFGKTIGWNPDFETMHQALLQPAFYTIINGISKRLDAIEATSQQALHCKTSNASPACAVTVRYLYQVYREQAPEQVFAQLLAGFELANKDPRVVGINMVQAENGDIAMRDYHLHMKMVGFLHEIYPNVHISLHAGESGPGVAPKEALRFHIWEAIDIAHAERIGHGLDVNYEDNAASLYAEMAKKHILVETTPSTELILGFESTELPFSQYLQRHVSVAISTDDEGVFRTNMTEQFENIVQTIIRLMSR
jgi:adenosine deaminase